MQYSWSGQRFALLTFADNTCLIDVSLHRIIIYINFPLIFAIWWALTPYYTRSYLRMNGRQRRALSFNVTTHTHTHTHTEACVTSQWEYKHTNNISRTALRVTSWAFHRFIWVKAFHILLSQKCKGIHSNRSKYIYFFEDSAEQIFVQQNVHTTTTKIIF